MCGISASVALVNSSKGQTSSCQFRGSNKELLERSLKRRGPDSFHEVTHDFNGKFDLYFCSSVLHLRGSELITQPVVDEKKNIFMWNGEIFTEGLVDGNDLINSNSDTYYMAKQLFSARDATDILHAFKNINGPYAFIFYQSNGFLWFGRDIFGRRSLLWNFQQSVFKLCSVAVDIHEGKWEEVPAAGFFCLDLKLSFEMQTFVIQQFSWSMTGSGGILKTKVDLPVPCTIAEIRHNFENTISIPISKLNLSLPEISAENLLHTMTNLLNMKMTEQELFEKLLDIPDFKKEVKSFETILGNAVKRRVGHQLNCCKNCYQVYNNFIPSCHHSYIGVLFSGGLDSLVIACLADRYVNPNSSIDLLNVAFAKKSNVGDTAYGAQFNTPDRITGRMGFQALKDLSPARKWNFVEINVTDAELNLMRVQRISELLYPSCSVLDDSIGCALWFASQGNGYICADDKIMPYKSLARVLLVGMGADEQLAGYSRHRAVFKNMCWQGLLNEISLELDRIGSRNLGRDDRIISDNAVESRYPFLDENVVSFLNSLPIWIKANLNFERGVGEKLLLRLLAVKLGLINSAMLPKRAIQFGSRIAKLENSKEKGSDICVRLLSAT